VVKIRFNNDSFFQGVGLVDRQDFPNRIVPQGKGAVSIKGEEFKPLFADKPPFAVLLDGISSGYQAIAGKSILPVIEAQNGLEIGQGDKGM
jgi:hypothetical protein